MTIVILGRSGIVSKVFNIIFYCMCDYYDFRQVSEVFNFELLKIRMEKSFKFFIPCQNLHSAILNVLLNIVPFWKGEVVAPPH